jgi:hypothetical protein
LVFGVKTITYFDFAWTLPDYIRGSFEDFFTKNQKLKTVFSGGERGIRTLGGLIRPSHDFQSCPFSLSGISPVGIFFSLVAQAKACGYIPKMF